MESRRIVGSTKLEMNLLPAHGNALIQDLAGAVQVQGEVGKSSDAFNAWNVQRQHGCSLHGQSKA